ncbi:odorant receptor 46a-like [Battus philenor]|uniref:odorant receptor 46a-like n=1 Tax=Battus philenor TaxID=42288 RepID=UPI0035D0A287
MNAVRQIDCFYINMIFLKILGIYPYKEKPVFYVFYSKCFLLIFIGLHDALVTTNFYYLPQQLDAYIEELLLYFAEMSVLSKVLTFLVMRKKIIQLLVYLEEPMFQPVTENGINIIKKAKRFVIRYWRILAAISYVCHLTHVVSSLFAHFLFAVPLQLPTCTYNFLSNETKERYIYFLYLYQGIGMHFHMLFNVNIDALFLGLMILTISQLDILNDKLLNITNISHLSKNNLGQTIDSEIKIYENDVIANFNQTIIHLHQIYKFCNLIQEVFSVTLFFQFCISSCTICVCLFRFTLPATGNYYVFLATYTCIMVSQILIPCWFGTQISEKSCLLSRAIYNCDWIPRPRKFKSSLRLFVERTNKSLSITGGKMFPLSLATFSSIMNTAYSFYTLLRHMQSSQKQI